MRRLTTFTTILGVAAMGTATAANADTFGSRVFHNQAHSLCLDAASQMANHNGGWVQLWQCVGGSNQHWLQPGRAGKSLVTNSWLPLVNQQAGLCLDAEAARDSQNGGPVMLWQCNGGANQNWSITDRGGYGQLVNQAHGLCLDAAYPAIANGTGMQLWSCYGGSNQTWSWPPGLMV